MIKENRFPIVHACTGTEEFTTVKGFAEHIPFAFSCAEKVKKKGIKRAYLIFYDNAEKCKFLKNLNVVFNFHSGSVFTKVFEYKNSLIAISPLGAPAAASLMEELSYFGITEFIAIGSAGCLDETLSSKFILVDKAIRDEGTSYHYLKPSVYVKTNENLNKELKSYLNRNNFDFLVGTTWTNDAFYRETKQKIEMAKGYGAVAVEMECAAWCAVAKFRGFKFAQILYFSDVVNQSSWKRLNKIDKNYKNGMQDKILSMVKDMIDNGDENNLL